MLQYIVSCELQQLRMDVENSFLTGKISGKVTFYCYCFMTTLLLWQSSLKKSGSKVVKYTSDNMGRSARQLHEDRPWGTWWRMSQTRSGNVWSLFLTMDGPNFNDRYSTRNYNLSLPIPSVLKWGLLGPCREQRFRHIEQSRLTHLGSISHFDLRK